MYKKRDFSPIKGNKLNRLTKTRRLIVPKISESLRNKRVLKG